MRAVELLVRAAGSSRSRAPVFVDKDRAGTEDRGRQLDAGEVAKVRRELERYAEFTAISEQIVEVNEKICEVRPVAGTDAPSAPEGEKGGCGTRSRRRRPPR